MKKIITTVVLLVVLMSAGIGNAAMDDYDFLNLCSEAAPREVAAAIKNGANVNAESKGMTALMYAAEDNANPEVIALLLKNGADINAGDGYTALMFAAMNNSNPEIVSLLLKNGADVNAKEEDEGYTALMLAAMSNPNPQVVSLLLKNGADAQAKNNEGKRAINFAGQNGNLKGTEAFKQLQKASNDANYMLGYSAGQEFAKQLHEAINGSSGNSGNNGSKNGKSSDPAIFILTNARKHSAPSGYNIYDVLPNVSFGTVEIRYVNILNPEKVRSGCKVKMIIKRNSAGIVQSYAVDEDGRPGGNSYRETVDARVID